MDEPDHLGGALTHRGTADSPGFLIDRVAGAGQGAGLQLVPADGGVGGDDPGHALGPSQIHHGDHILVAQVRRDLHQQRSALVVLRLQPRQDRLQLTGGLQVPQPRRVRGGDIDHEVVAQVPQQPEAADVVLRRIGQGGDLRLAQVHPQGYGVGRGADAGLQPLRHGGGALVVEAHTVERRQILR